MDPINSTLPQGFVRSSRTMTLKLAPAGSVQAIQRVPQAGIRFYIVECSTDAAIRIKTDKTQQESFTVGTGKEFPPEMVFTALEVENTSAVAITVVLFAGFGDYIDRRTTIVGNRLTSILPTIEPETQLVSVKVAGVPVASIAAGADIPAPGTPSATQLRRKAVMIVNLDAASVLQLKDANGDIAHTIFPSTAQIIPVSTLVSLHNGTGASIACQFSEIYWLLP